MSIRTIRAKAINNERCKELPMINSQRIIVLEFGLYNIHAGTDRRIVSVQENRYGLLVLQYNIEIFKYITI